MIYDPTVFDAADRSGIANIILTPEVGLSTEQRWIRETDWLLDRLALPYGLVVDYGCGIGRIARHLEQPVLGVDISPVMRAEALVYHPSPMFGVVSPLVFDLMVHQGLQADAAYAVWVLQHTIDPAGDIRLLHRAIKPNGLFVLVNRVHRCVPVVHEEQRGWLDDKVDFDPVLNEHFELISSEDMPAELCQPGAYLRHYRRRPW